MPSPENHKHVWGPVEYARFTGTPHRKCLLGVCGAVSLDLEGCAACGDLDTFPEGLDAGYCERCAMRRKV